MTFDSWNANKCLEVLQSVVSVGLVRSFVNIASEAISRKVEV